MPVRVRRICRQRGATKSGTWLRKTVLTVLQGQGPGKAFEGPAPEACPWPANVDNEDDNLSRGFSVGKLDGGWGSKETLRCEIRKVRPYEEKKKGYRNTSCQSTFTRPRKAWQRTKPSQALIEQRGWVTFTPSSDQPPRKRSKLCLRLGSIGGMAANKYEASASPNPSLHKASMYGNAAASTSVTLARLNSKAVDQSKKRLKCWCLSFPLLLTDLVYHHQNDERQHQPGCLLYQPRPPASTSSKRSIALPSGAAGASQLWRNTALSNYCQDGLIVHQRHCSKTVELVPSSAPLNSRNSRQLERWVYEGSGKSSCLQNSWRVKSNIRPSHLHHSSGTSGRGDSSTVHWASSHPNHPGRALPDSLNPTRRYLPQCWKPHLHQKLALPKWSEPQQCRQLTLPQANQDLGNAVENPWHTKCCQEGEPP